MTPEACCLCPVYSGISFWSLSWQKTLLHKDEMEWKWKWKQVFQGFCGNRWIFCFDFNPEHVCVLSRFSCVGPYGLWTILSMGSSRQEDWNGLPSPPPEDLPDPGIELVPLMSPALEAGSLLLAPPSLQVLVAQLCLTLCDLMDCSPPGSSVHGISRQEYWSGLPFLSPGDLPDPGIRLFII